MVLRKPLPALSCPPSYRKVLKAALSNGNRSRYNRRGFRLCPKTPMGVAVVDGHTSAAWVGDPTDRLFSGGSLRSTPATLAGKLSLKQSLVQRFY